jgi:acyl carrier protein
MDQNDKTADEITAVIRSVGKVPGEVPLDKDLYSDVGVKSIDSIEILLALEDRFGIAIDDTQFIKARTVRLLTNLVLTTRAA